MRVPSLAVAVSSFAILFQTAALNPAGAQPAAQEAPQEVTLTQKQLDNLVAAHKDVSAVEAKIPESAEGAPPPAVMGQLDGAAKKYGFAGYGDYQNVGQTVSMVMSGFDFESKKYVGAAVVLKKQIAEVQADKSMSPADKKQALAELNESLQSAGSMKPMPGNIDLVGKNFDKLSAVFQQDD